MWTQRYTDRLNKMLRSKIASGRAEADISALTWKWFISTRRALSEFDKTRQTVHLLHLIIIHFCHWCCSRLCCLYDSIVSGLFSLQQIWGEGCGTKFVIYRHQINLFNYICWFWRFFYKRNRSEHMEAEKRSTLACFPSFASAPRQQDSLPASRETRLRSRLHARPGLSLFSHFY